MKNHDIIGRWYIVAWRQDYDDGRVTFPLGERLRGFVQYDMDGNVQLLVTSGDRKNFETGGQWNADASEKARAYDTCMSYAGTFEIAGEEIHHHVAVSLFPNWVGGIQKRKAAIVDGELRLIARLESGTPEARTATLFWRRARDGEVLR